MHLLVQATATAILARNFQALMVRMCALMVLCVYCDGSYVHCDGTYVHCDGTYVHCDGTYVCTVQANPMQEANPQFTNVECF